MTANELAAKIDGREYGYDIFRDVKEKAKQDGLVIVYVMSDDLMEFEGAINDEAGVWGGGEVFVNSNEAFKSTDCGCGTLSCPYYREMVNRIKKIKAIWHDSGNPSWTYETDIPHSTFRIMEDGEVYCVGIVFSVEDLK